MCAPLRYIGGAELQLHSFLISTLGEDVWSLQVHTAFLPGKNPLPTEYESGCFGDITWTHVCVWCSPQPSQSVPWILWWVMWQPCWPGSHRGHGRSTEADHTELKHKKTIVKLALPHQTDILAHECTIGLVRPMVLFKTVSANLIKLCFLWLTGESGHCHSSKSEDKFSGMWHCAEGGKQFTTF